MQVAGYVLAGGNSLRMGRDKARLPAPTGLLVEEMASTVAKVADEVCLVGARDRYRDLRLRCLDDLRPGCGPLGGLETSLADTLSNLNVVVACDMPGLQERWLNTLVRAAAESPAACVIVQDAGGRRHPLLAIWKREALPWIRSALDRRDLRMFHLLEQLEPEIVKLDEVVQNVNTPPEWAAWQADSVLPAVS